MLWAVTGFRSDPVDEEVEESPGEGLLVWLSCDESDTTEGHQYVVEVGVRPYRFVGDAGGDERTEGVGEHVPGVHVPVARRVRIVGRR